MEMLQKNHIRDRWLLLTIPAVLFTLLLSTYPTVMAVLYSIYPPGADGTLGQFAGLREFRTVIANPLFWKAAVNTASFITASTLLHLVLGTAVSLLLMAGVSVRFRNAARAVILLPWALTPVVVALLWRVIYQPQFSPIAVMAERLFGVTNLPIDFLARPNIALLGVILANVWSVTPFYMLMILARLQNVPVDILEAAAVDGAGSWRKFFNVVLPQLKGILGTLAVFDIIGTSVYFDLIWVMTKGGPANSTEVLATFIYKTAFQQFEFGQAAAAGLMLFAIIIAISSVFALTTREG